MIVATPHSIGFTSSSSTTSESPGSAPFDRDRAGRAVDPLEVDAGDQVLLAPDLAREAVVRLQADDRAGLDLEHGLEVRAERPDDLVAADELLRGGGHRYCPACVGAAATVSSSTKIRFAFSSACGRRIAIQIVSRIPIASHAIAIQFA